MIGYYPKSPVYVSLKCINQGAHIKKWYISVYLILGLFNISLKQVYLI